jgi:ZIP family zinc transporter
MAIALGALLDGVPESVVIGLSLAQGGEIGIALVAGFFLANIPQGLSSASGMRKAGRSPRYIYSVWIGIPLISCVAAAVGAVALGSTSPVVSALILSFAAGGVLAMLAESMIPEAFDDAQPFIGVFTVFGFLAAFLIIQSQV